MARDPTEHIVKSLHRPLDTFTIASSLNIKDHKTTVQKNAVPWACCLAIKQRKLSPFTITPTDVSSIPFGQHCMLIGGGRGKNTCSWSDLSGYFAVLFPWFWGEWGGCCLSCVGGQPGHDIFAKVRGKQRGEGWSGSERSVLGAPPL